MSRRSKPLLIAPLVPLLSFAGILGLDQFRGSRYLHVFVILWCAAMAALTVYVIRQAMAARRLQKGAR